ncbi:MAG: sugar phosphate isomerase/epimerase [Acidobacteria bacterium]|jgi:sugar phosphate isomerase/epimerase|nr:sugar phosphate isomerase/epimerase [Bryobacteraceae bacterium CoA2 C42]
MQTLSRRTFVAASAAALTLEAKSLKTFGAQLYSLRSIIDKDPLVVLQGLEAAGYTEAEVIRGNMDKIWSALKQTKLKPVSLHIDTRMFTADIDKLNATLDDAKQRGFRYAVCPYIAPQDRGGVDVIKKLADTLNQAGQRCQAAGIQLCYHNHAFEFEPVKEGGTLLDVLMKNTDPKLVGLELDIMWAQVGGVEPVKLFAQYKGRIPLVHMKNVKAGIGPQYHERVPREAFEEVGKGVIAIGPVLQAAQKAGAKHFFVEQDQTPGNPLDSLRGSAQYLKSLNF